MKDLVSRRRLALQATLAFHLLAQQCNCYCRGRSAFNAQFAQGGRGKTTFLRSHTGKFRSASHVVVVETTNSRMRRPIRGFDLILVSTPRRLPCCVAPADPSPFCDP